MSVFSSFSSAARRVLRTAEQECRNHNHYYLGVEHLLLGLLHEPDEAIDRRLLERGLERGEIAAATRRAMGTGEDRTWEGILVTPRLRRVVTRAESLAGGEAVDPAHLLQAVEEETGGLAVEILQPRR
ncbi:MAG TPA: Clp protease N-terminal domain-containing protein [Candidatus Dormibacteraeota bacterium]|nr:Clp protease N-terminal domain-containing protein [Candidatus Dormibacteraeota bacterium]